MITNGGIATIGERAGAPVTNPSHIIGVSTEIPGSNSTRPQTQTRLKTPAILTDTRKKKVKEKYWHIIIDEDILIFFTGTGCLE